MAGAKKIRNHGSSQKKTGSGSALLMYSYRQISLILPADYIYSWPSDYIDAYLLIQSILICRWNPFLPADLIDLACRLHPFLPADYIYSYLQITFILTYRFHSFLQTDYIHSYPQITFILTCRLHPFVSADYIHSYLQIKSIHTCRLHIFLPSDSIHSPADYIHSYLQITFIFTCRLYNQLYRDILLNITTISCWKVASISFLWTAFICHVPE